MFASILESPLGPIKDGTRGAPPSKRFGIAKTLPQAEFISAEDVQSFWGPHLMQSNGVGGPKWTRTTDLTIISRAL